MAWGKHIQGTKPNGQMQEPALGRGSDGVTRSGKAGIEGGWNTQRITTTCNHMKIMK